MTTTLLTNRIQKSLKGHLSSTIRTSSTEQKKKTNMGVYIIIKKTPRGLPKMYVGATTNINQRATQHRCNFGDKGFAFFQVVDVTSSPMLSYIEQITINTLQSIIGEKFNLLNVRSPAFDCLERNLSIKNKLQNIITRFENGERGLIFG